MKKVLALLLVVIMVVSVVSCGNEDISHRDMTPDDDTKETEKISQETERGDITANEDITTDMSGESTTSKPKDEKPIISTDALSMKKNATIEEVVLYDKNDIKISSQKLEYNNYEVELSLIFENNTKDDLSFLTGANGHSCNSINGYMVQDGYLNCDVSAGKKSVDTISFNYKELYFYGIQEIADITISFAYHKEDVYTYSYTDSLVIKTSIYDSYHYNQTYTETIKDKKANAQLDVEVKKFFEEELYSQEKLKLVSCAFATLDDEQVVVLEYVNNDDRYYNVRVKDIVINGLALSYGNFATIGIDIGKRCVQVLNFNGLIEEKFYDDLSVRDITTLNFDIEVVRNDYKTIIKDVNMNLILSDKQIAADKSGEEAYNANDIRVVKKGLFYEDEKYGDDYHIVYLIENNTSKEISITRDSFSLNGFMLNVYSSSAYVKSGMCGLLIISFDSDDLDDISVAKLEDIREYEIDVKIRTVDYKTIAEFKIKG